MITHTHTATRFLGLLLLVVLFSTSSCSKDNQDLAFSDSELSYERYPSGSYNMIWLPSAKSLSDKEYVKGFQKKLHNGEMKSNDVLPLNESIFAVEGVLNFEKCDATPTRVVDEDFFELTIEIESIDANGVVWVAESELAELYDQIIPNTQVGVDEKLSTIDLDVIDISSTSVQIRVVKTVSKKQQGPPPPPLEWFDETDQYKALGVDVLDGSYLANDCQTNLNALGEEYMTPCHVGYPAEPYPSWVLINDELLSYGTTLSNVGMNGNDVWVQNGKIWYTNLIDPINAQTIVSYYTQDFALDCPYGRRDKIYMAGNFNSNYPGNLLSGPGGCGCDIAQEPVFADFACGEYAIISANLPDENVSGEQMNRYMQSCIDHIDAHVTYWAGAGLPNAAVASIRYYGYALYTSSWPGLSGPGHLRYHNCLYVIGTRNS